MTTDQKIREAYENAVKNDPYMSSLVVFTGGYKAALDDLMAHTTVAEKLAKLSQEMRWGY